MKRLWVGSRACCLGCFFTVLFLSCSSSGTSPVAAPADFGLGFVADPQLTGPGGNDGGAFATSGVGFSGQQLGGLSGSAALPPAADLSQWNPPVGSQGQVASCMSWTMSYSLGSWWANKLGLVRNQFSPMALYSRWAAATCGGSSNTLRACGGSPEALDAIVQQYGLDPVVDYDPNMPSMFANAGASLPNFGADCASNDFTDQPSVAATSLAATYNLTAFSYREVPQTKPSVNQAYCPGFPGTSTWIQQQIANGVPLVVGIPIWPEFSGYNGSVPISPPSADEIAQQTALDALPPGQRDGGTPPYSGNHAMFCDKYDANGLWCQNQWGTGWPADAQSPGKGWWQLSWSFVDQCAIEEATAVLTFAPAPSAPFIAAPDGGSVSCSPLTVDVDVLLGPVQLNGVTLYANGTQVAQLSGYQGKIIDGGVAVLGQDGWAEDFAFNVNLPGAVAAGPVALTAVAVDDAGLTGTSAAVTVNCQSSSGSGAGPYETLAGTFTAPGISATFTGAMSGVYAGPSAAGTVWGAGSTFDLPSIPLLGPTVTLQSSPYPADSIGTVSIYLGATGAPAAGPICDGVGIGDSVNLSFTISSPSGTVLASFLNPGGTGSVCTGSVDTPTFVGETDMVLGDAGVYFAHGSFTAPLTGDQGGSATMSATW